MRVANGARWVSWFGTDGGAIVTVAAPGEPAVCPQIREQLKELDHEIADLTGQLIGDPREDAPIRLQIGQLKGERQQVTDRGAAAGCAL
jgi:hypothetical protein